MREPLRTIPPTALVAGWDFSTGSVKGLIFNLEGQVIAECRFPTDLWTAGGVSELNLMQLEGQARATTRALAAQLREQGRLTDWLAGGISATHHTAARIDAQNNPVRRAICWNDQTLAQYHAAGLARLGGQDRARELTGGPWAVRYSLSHLMKDAQHLPLSDWARTRFLIQHGALAAGYLTGRFDCVSISAAASTGLLDLRTGQWARGMLDAIENPQLRDMAWASLPTILNADDPVGLLSASLAADVGLVGAPRPMVFPTLDDQAAGLIGGGATDAGHVAVILGNSAVVNSSSSQLPQSGNLDAMRLNHGPYLWMRCYSNGAQFLDPVVGTRPDWSALEIAARAVSPGCMGTMVLPFVLSEPSLGILAPRFAWLPQEPTEPGIRFRAALEALAYLIALGVREHEMAGQTIRRIAVSGGIARSDLMIEILAAVLNRPVQRLASDEGPALGAAVAALAGLESYGRQQQGITDPYTITDAVAQLVRFRGIVAPRRDWVEIYQAGRHQFERAIAHNGS
ncbi:MAG: hypothetical protein LC104_16525 [Bacteroidales bacterium]|nr:hypothetical protein [Bacteroidales bacterium]